MVFIKSYAIAHYSYMVDVVEIVYIPFIMHIKIFVFVLVHAPLQHNHNK